MKSSPACTVTTAEEVFRILTKYTQRLNHATACRVEPDGHPREGGAEEWCGEGGELHHSRFTCGPPRHKEVRIPDPYAADW